MRFENLDLNLLVILDAFLQERSVSRAAERVNITQSGASASLARLREFFDDEILVPSGRNMALTARGEKLAQPVRAALDQIRATIIADRPFDPKTSDRTISIAAIDVAIEVFLARAISGMADDAPDMRFEIRALKDDGPLVELQRGSSDIVITLEHMLHPEYPHAWLYDEKFVVVGWSENPYISGPMTRELYEQLGHVSVRLGSNAEGFEETVLRRLGFDRRVEVFTPTFTSIARFLIGTRRIATIHERLAIEFARTMPIAVTSLPAELPVIREFAQWTRGNANDPAINWVVERLKAFASQHRFASP